MLHKSIFKGHITTHNINHDISFISTARATLMEVKYHFDHILIFILQQYCKDDYWYFEKENIWLQ